MKKEDEYVIEYAEMLQPPVRKQKNDKGWEYEPVDLDGAEIYLDGRRVDILYDHEEVWFDILTMAQILWLPADKLTQYSEERKQWAESDGKYYAPIALIIEFYNQKYLRAKDERQKAIIEKFRIWDWGFKAALCLLKAE